MNVDGKKWEVFIFSIYVVLKGGKLWESSLVLMSIELEY